MPFSNPDLDFHSHMPWYFCFVFVFFTDLRWGKFYIVGFSWNLYSWTETFLLSFSNVYLIIVLQIMASMYNCINKSNINTNSTTPVPTKINIYSETCVNRTLSKPKTCLNQTDFTVPSTKCLCNLNLCKPNTCLNWTNSSVPKGFCLDRFNCS